MTPKYLEENLDIPLRQVLQTIQDRTMRESHYLGIPTWKCPLDLWCYRELIFERRPDVIIEIGNYRGGSTLALAHICDALNSGRVIGIDIHQAHIPVWVREHPRVTLIEGDACDCLPRVQALISPAERVFIIEDSAHTFENTRRVLEVYSPLVKPNDYFIVEDSICHHGLDVGPSPGPYEAVADFLRDHPEFVSDRLRESFLVTWCPTGYLRRRSEEEIRGS